MRPHPLTLLLLLTGCSPVKISLDTAVLGDPLGPGGLDTGSVEDSIGTDTGAPAGSLDTEPPRPDALWCLDFEDGSLEGAGYDAGDLVQLWDGALVLNAFEGQDFSALVGEESLAFRGDRALAMRSNDQGEVGSVSIATSPSFVVEQPALFWWTLSEVDERGVYLGLDLLSEDGVVLASAELPAPTGGFVPGLEPEYAPIDDFPEITVGAGTPGTFTAQQIDLSPYLGQSIKLRLYQHTRLEGQGFFTLVDDICHGPPIDEAETITLGDPLDHGA